MLYIEDDAANVRLVEHILGEIHDLQIVSAATGEHGLRLARELDLSLILLDLHLRTWTASRCYSACGQARRRALCRSWSSAVTFPGARRVPLAGLGSVAFLDKPYAIADTIRIVKTLVAPSGTSRR